MFIQHDMAATMADSVSIRKSDIHGVGIFADIDIQTGTIIHKTHLRDKNYGWINFIPNSKYNHSISKANCELTQKGETKELVSIKYIKKDQEILVDYNQCSEIQPPEKDWKD